MEPASRRRRRRGHERRAAVVRAGAAGHQGLLRDINRRANRRRRVHGGHGREGQQRAVVLPRRRRRRLAGVVGEARVRHRRAADDLQLHAVRRQAVLPHQAGRVVVRRARVLAGSPSAGVHRRAGEADPPVRDGGLAGVLRLPRRRQRRAPPGAPTEEIRDPCKGIAGDRKSCQAFWMIPPVQHSHIRK